MKNKLLVAAVVLVGLASVAYAAFTQTLTINGTGNATGDWDVKITSITQTAATGATEVSAPTFNETSATFAVNLAYPGASATYDIALANQGNIDAVLDSISGLTDANSAAPTYIDYTLTGVAVSDTLLDGATDTATVTVEWDPLDTTSNPAATKTATITLNYVQAP